CQRRWFLPSGSVSVHKWRRDHALAGAVARGSKLACERRFDLPSSAFQSRSAGDPPPAAGRLATRSCLTPRNVTDNNRTPEGAMGAIQGGGVRGAGGPCPGRPGRRVTLRCAAWTREKGAGGV